MYSEASKNLSTQLARQFDSLRENERPGVPVTHLHGKNASERALQGDTRMKWEICRRTFASTRQSARE
jgi:hypothetical protein